MIEGLEPTPDQQERIRRAIEKVPFARVLQIELVGATEGAATLKMPVLDEFKQINGVMHGGAIASLIDTATAFAIVLLVEDGERFTTIDLTINYLRPLTQGVAFANARVLRAGRRVISVTADVTDGSGKVAATALSTYLRL